MTNNAAAFLELNSWIQSHVAAIYTAPSDEAFDVAFDAFLSQNVDITVNDQALSRDQYKQLVQAQMLKEAGKKFNLLKTDMISGPEGSPDLVVNPVSSSEANESDNTKINLIVMVVIDPTIPAPSLWSRMKGEVFDPRRVSILKQVIGGKGSLPISEYLKQGSDRPNDLDGTWIWI